MLLSSVSFGLVVSDVMGTLLTQRGCVIFLPLAQDLFLFMVKRRESATKGICMQPSLIAASPLPSLLHTPLPGRRNTKVLKQKNTPGCALQAGKLQL